MSIVRTAAAASLVLLTLAGCAFKAGPDYRAPELPVPASFGPAVRVLEPGVSDMPGWWRGFGDEALDAWVARALDENLDVAATAVRVEESRALLRAVRAGRSPRLDAQAGASAQERLSGRSSPGASSSAGREGVEATASVLLSWSPDLFGGQARAEEAALAEARRREALWRDTARLVAAQVVRAYVELRLAQTRAAALSQALQLQQRTLEIVRVRHEAGLASNLDVNRVAADLARTQAQRGTLALAEERARHALAVLAGRWPRDASPSPAGMQAVPRYRGAPAAAAPRELLRRRPDLAAAEANLARATADIGVAASRLYPNLGLPGSLSAGVSGLGSGEVARSVVAALSVVLDIPLFDGGARRAEVDAARWRAREALLAYRATLLVALEEAENALVAIEAAQATEARLVEAVTSSERAVEQAQVLYREGLSPLLDVLDAQRILVASRDALAQARADLALAINDFQASVGAMRFGGG